MKSFFRLLLALFVLLPPLAADAQKIRLQPNLTILADRSLMLPLAELTRLFSTQTGTSLTIIRNIGSDPARQLEQGFDAHILLSADPTLVERLAQRGLIDVFGTQNFASTQLALVAPYRMKQRLTLAKRISFAALIFSQPDLPVYTTDLSTPGGLRAQALMEGKEFSHDLAQRTQVKPSYEAMVTALQEKDSFALMLAANAVTEPNVTIVSLLPESVSDPVRYDAVVLASDAMEQARAFTKFLRSPAAQAILQRYGFQPAVEAKEED